MLINEVELHDEHVVITVIGKDYKHKVLLDKDDFVKLVGKIRISKEGYAYLCNPKENERPEYWQTNNGLKKRTTMKASVAYWILDIEGSNNQMCIDHINGNTLDNRKKNLRYVTISENNRNKHSFTRTTTGVNGISYRVDKGRTPYYRVTWSDYKTKKTMNKKFNIKKYGKEKAFELAQEYLKERKKENKYLR